MDFAKLVQGIVDIHRQTRVQATKAVNISLTLRNWLIGAYIAEFELRGEDRATYGDALFGRLGHRLTEQNVSNCSKSRLYRYRDFYRFYPQIVATLPPLFSDRLSVLDISTNPAHPIKVATPSPLSGILLLERLSYSHFELLLEISDEWKRAFYEVECIKGNWSVRELKRQIASLYFERSGFSKRSGKLSKPENATAFQSDPVHVIRDPYIFEFLGLKPGEVLPESDLEAALIDRMRDFLLELGHGFCFEAKQKRLLIGDEHFFVDLVFYHRVLKCHVLVEIKVGAFSHEHLGQLNTYVSYYRAHEMGEGDQPPIGILLCTDKNHALVEYALAGMDNRLFVSKYQLELPQTEVLQRYLDEQRQALEGGK
ncbi:MAG: PDDEXK nuclease domain-containing protein [Candidatus Accumulibacter sp.]|jgi:predicted nuclease of restriction endonuclease-like (RecB) superfamily|nr:PDDEXK nuclease domain-containing protein [Accumulibacter sp.]